MSVFFTSDLHFGHQKVAEDRNFETTGEHDASIIDSLVDQTQVGDQVWILGDLSKGGTTAENRALVNLRLRLPGRSLHLIAGNHDSCHPMTNRNSHNRIKAFYPTFDSVQFFARRRIGGQQVLLSHFPYSGDHTEHDRGVQFRLRDEGEWLLHGHTHSQERGPAWDSSIVWNDGGRSKYPNHKQIHVGWDAWGRLVTLEELEEIING